MPHLSKISIIEWNSLFSSWQMRLMPFRATQVDFPKRKFKKFHICKIYEFTGIRLLNHPVFLLSRLSSLLCLLDCMSFFLEILFQLVSFFWGFMILVHWSQSFFCVFLGNTLSIVATDGSLRWRMGRRTGGSAKCTTCFAYKKYFL